MRDTKSGAGGKDGRADRRAEALRANLRRRKLQRRSRAAATNDTQDIAATPPADGTPRRDET